jgi:hypothetical protein
MPVVQQITNVLKAFDPVTLSEIDPVSLLHRCDTKYVFNLRLLPAILDEAKGHYRILEINQERFSGYKTIYYDTRNFTFFNDHITGKSNRQKIRHRTYESTGTSYLEVKSRLAKNRTLKWRIPNEIKNSFDPAAAEFLKSRTSMDLENLYAVMTNYFKRITLVNMEEKTRITLDFDLMFRGNPESDQKLPFVAVAEIKKDGNDPTTVFNRILKKRGIRTARFSKYCMGSAMTNAILRRNILKPNFLLLKRIQEEYDSCISE